MTVPVREARTVGVKYTDAPVHVVLVGTKPDIIKQAPVYHSLVERGHQALVCHTGQHFDHSLSGAMLEEFGVASCVNLGVAGGPVGISSGIIAEFGRYLSELREDVGPPIVYAHGDTTTAMSGAVAAFQSGVQLVHVEAGLRTLSPTREVLAEWIALARERSLEFDRFARQSRESATYERGSREPSPEQFNTRVVDAAAHLHAVPVELNRDFLLEEGFDPATIRVVGNSVVDALDLSTRTDVQDELLATFPQLASGEFIRYCVHRRENTVSHARFVSLFEALEALLENGASMLFVRLNATEAAIDRFGLRGRLNDLQARHGERFITTPVWDNYAHVIAAMRLCSIVATDSGSIQEEVNALGVPCVTLRFGSDRGESLLSGGNFLAPPVDSTTVFEIIDAVYRNRARLRWDSVYHPGASRRLVEAVESSLDRGRLEISEERRYGL